jgi:rRNA processing protein Gar1
MRVGTVLHLSSSSGNLILKAEGDVKIGETILDSTGSMIGTVFDLFGPVSGPFVAVKPRIQYPEKLQGETLFHKRKGR